MSNTFRVKPIKKPVDKNIKKYPHNWKHLIEEENELINEQPRSNEDDADQRTPSSI